MSMGYGAFARKVLEDEKTIIYEYGGFDLNKPEFRNEDHRYDGMITILKQCFPEPEIHEKLKKMPGGRKKLIIKCIPVEADYWKMIDDGFITVENCSNTWNAVGEGKQVDRMALRLISLAFHQYQEKGEIPEKLDIYC
jgi:hypothetical protein